MSVAAGFSCIESRIFRDTGRLPARAVRYAGRRATTGLTAPTPGFGHLASRRSRMAQQAPQSREEKIRQDVHDLHGLGYAQELFRTMGGFSNFAISFTIISILTGAVILFEMIVKL